MLPGIGLLVPPRVMVLHGKYRLAEARVGERAEILFLPRDAAMLAQSWES